MVKYRSALFPLVATIVCVLAVQASARTLILDRIIIGLQPGTDAQRYFGEHGRAFVRLFADCYLLPMNVSTPEEIFDECARWLAEPQVRFAEPDWIDDWADWIIYPPPVFMLTPVVPIVIPPLFIASPVAVPSPRVGNGPYSGNLPGPRRATPLIKHLQGHRRLIDRSGPPGT